MTNRFTEGSPPVSMKKWIPERKWPGLGQNVSYKPGPPPDVRSSAQIAVDAFKKKFPQLYVALDDWLLKTHNGKTVDDIGEAIFSHNYDQAETIQGLLELARSLSSGQDPLQKPPQWTQAQRTPVAPKPRARRATRPARVQTPPPEPEPQSYQQHIVSPSYNTGSPYSFQVYAHQRMQGDPVERFVNDFRQRHGDKWWDLVGFAARHRMTPQDMLGKLLAGRDPADVENGLLELIQGGGINP